MIDSSPTQTQGADFAEEREWLNRDPMAFGGLRVRCRSVLALVGCLKSLNEVALICMSDTERDRLWRCRVRLAIAGLLAGDEKRTGRWPVMEREPALRRGDGVPPPF